MTKPIACDQPSFHGADLKLVLYSDNEEGVPECTPVWNETFNGHLSLWKQKKRIKGIDNIDVYISVYEGCISKIGSRLISGLDLWSIDDPTTYNGKQEASGERQTELVASSLCLGSKVQLSESGIGNLLLRDGEAYLKIAINRGACNKSNRVKEGSFTVSCSLTKGTAYGEARFYLTRYFLQVVKEDEERIFYKHEGGKRRFMYCDVELGDSFSKEGPLILPEVPVRAALYYENGVIPSSQSPLSVLNSLDELKVNPHDRYWICSAEEHHPLRVKFRIEEVSKKHDNMKFRIKVFSAPCDNDGSGELNHTQQAIQEISPSQLHSMLGFIKPCFTSPIHVLSKRRCSSVRRSKKDKQFEASKDANDETRPAVPTFEENKRKKPHLDHEQHSKDENSDVNMSDAVPPALESGESCISGENIPSPFSDLSKSDKGDRSSFSINEKFFSTEENLASSETCLSKSESSESSPFSINEWILWVNKVLPLLRDLQWHPVGFRSCDSKGCANLPQIPIRQCPSCYRYASNEPGVESQHKSTCKLAEVLKMSSLAGLEGVVENKDEKANREHTMKRTKTEQFVVPTEPLKTEDTRALKRKVHPILQKLNSFSSASPPPGPSSVFPDPSCKRLDSASTDAGTPKPAQLTRSGSSFTLTRNGSSFKAYDAAISSRSSGDQVIPEYIRLLSNNSDATGKSGRPSIQFWLDHMQTKFDGDEKKVMFILKDRVRSTTSDTLYWAAFDEKKKFIGLYHESIGGDCAYLNYCSANLEELQQSPQELEESLKNALAKGEKHIVISRQPHDTPESYHRRLLLSTMCL